MRSERGISIDADSGPLNYVFLRCSSICYLFFTFVQIGTCHKGAFFSESTDAFVITPTDEHFSSLKLKVLILVTKNQEKLLRN